jgi:hypothetical protein
MPPIQIPSSAPRHGIARRPARTVRRTIVILGVIGLTAVMAAGSALAGVGSEPGNLKLSPASGVGTLTPGWSTTDGCPAGYRGSAQMAEFTVGGRLISRISPTVAIVTTAFRGTLDGTIGAILRETGVRKGTTVVFAIGCWSLEGGTGKVKYIQSTNVTYSSTGTSYATNSSNAGGSANGGQGTYGYYTGQGSTSGGGHSVSATDTANSSGMNAGGLAALISGGCLLVLALAGYAWHRRRDRSRLM